MIIKFSKIIDLTHPIQENMPHWPGDPGTAIKRAATVALDGYNLNALTIGEHSGTHCGAPRHFNDAGQTIDKIVPDHFVAAGIVVDLRGKTASNRDYLLTAKDINAWEEKFGLIKRRSVVLIQTGWSQFWSIPTQYFGNIKNTMHFPGVSLEAAKLLANQREIVGLGIDTAGLDGGQSTDFATNRYLADHGVYHLENLNLVRLDLSHFILVVAPLPIQNGSGSPCRVFALV
jgi:kynurenine formamidase